MSMVIDVNSVKETRVVVDVWSCYDCDGDKWFSRVRVMKGKKKAIEACARKIHW